MRYQHLQKTSSDEYRFNALNEQIDSDSLRPSSEDIIPLVLGNARVKGRLIYNVGITKAPNLATFAIGICQGPITSVNSIYVNGAKEIFKEGKCTVHLGTLDQSGDQTLLAYSEYIPAFRGLAYVVFHDFPLQGITDENLDFDLHEIPYLPDFECEIPQFYFDVLVLRHEHQQRVSKIRAVNIIPGCGEFVYDTRCLYKDDDGRKINYFENLANSVVNLNFLKKELPAVKWVSPVVCWFGDNKDIEKCTISPRVEYGPGSGEVFKSDGSKIEWKVSKYSRSTAKVVGFDDVGMRYGGTISDESVISYLALLKGNGYKIMFYPMVFLDIAGKPWRGEMNGSHTHVQNFFTKTEGYNNFILHYAQLVKDYVDAFVIGSELEGITSIYNTNHDSREFLAAKELSQLAKKVREIFNKSGKENIKITYAANWSEYHHKEGWYHLDELWMSEAIDFIGIDAYFPATDTYDSDIDYGQIKEGYKKGDTYEYYYDSGTRKYCDPNFALKNVEYWWKNLHFNPNGKCSAWIPESKPVWFTEFGFASLDKSTNEPNVFFDDASGGNLPKFSSKEIDFALQEEAICALVDHFDSIQDSKGSKMVEQMFLWCWDARYPVWPDKFCIKDSYQYIETYISDLAEERRLGLWSDSPNWELGHWINGKFSGISIREVVEEVFIKSGFSTKDFTIDAALSGLVRGLIINYTCAGSSLLETLRLLYKFDIFCTPEGIFRVIARDSNFDVEQNANFNKLSFENLRNSADYPSFRLLQSPSNNKALEIAFIKEQSPELGFMRTCTDPKQKIVVMLPVLISLSKAYSFANKILQSIQEKNSLVVVQAPFYFDVHPTQVIELQISEKFMLVRVISVNFHQREKELICVKLPSLKSEKSLLLP